MPFILDDRKLLCCQDAAAEIEGRSYVSILWLESYSNEFVGNGVCICGEGDVWLGWKSGDKQMSGGEQSCSPCLLFCFPTYSFLCIHGHKHALQFYSPFPLLCTPTVVRVCIREWEQSYIISHLYGGFGWIVL